MPHCKCKHQLLGLTTVFDVIFLRKFTNHDDSTVAERHEQRFHFLFVLLSLRTSTKWQLLSRQLRDSRE